MNFNLDLLPTYLSRLEGIEKGQERGQILMRRLVAMAKHRAMSIVAGYVEL